IIPVLIVFAGLLFDRKMLVWMTLFAASLTTAMVLGRWKFSGLPFNRDLVGDLSIFLVTLILAAILGHVLSQHVLHSLANVLEGQHRLRESADALQVSEQRWHLALLGTNDGIWD